MAFGFFCLLVSLALVASGSASRERRNAQNIKVTTVLEEPFTIQNDSLTGNNRYTGFVPELLEKIFTKLNRQYTIRLVEDGKYGSQDENGRWSGMIGEVIRSVADLAAGPITIAAPREEAVDFTKPIMSFGTVILAKKPANGEELPFSNIDELKDSNIGYGAVTEGHTQSFFKNSNVPKYQAIWTNMQSNPSNQVDSVADGVKKVRSSNGKYAFIMESSSAEFWVSKPPCDLVIVGQRLNANGYGLVTRKGDPLRDDINGVLLELRETGEMQLMINKWWSTGDKCNSGMVWLPNVWTTIFGAITLAVVIRL